MNDLGPRIAPRAQRFMAIALSLAVLACESTPASEPAPPVVEFKLPTLDFEAVATERQTREASQAQVQRGLQCGWRGGWMSVLRDSRHDAPAAFRSKAVGSAFGWGGVLFLIGLTGTLALAWVLPRMRRRAAARAPKDATPQSWASYFKGLVGRFLSRLGRALRVEHFDPLLANERQRMVETCRDAERQLAVAHLAVTQLGSPTDPTGAPNGTQSTALGEQISAWRGEVMALRRRLEGPTHLPPELSPDRIAPRLAVVLRAARDLRIACERAVISGPAHESTWLTLERELKERPETPRDRATSPHADLAPWVRTVGFAGLGGLTFALPMLACWMAAGAFPLFFALLFGLGALGAVLLARVHLHRAGRLPLLPGFADRVASWLTAVLALTLLATIVSSWMSADGGLDMGDAPPVAMPDPRLLEAPRLFPDVPSPSPAPTPAPAPAPTSTE